MQNHVIIHMIWTYKTWFHSVLKRKLLKKKMHSCSQSLFLNVLDRLFTEQHLTWWWYRFGISTSRNDFNITVKLTQTGVWSKRQGIMLKAMDFIWHLTIRYIFKWSFDQKIFKWCCNVKGWLHISVCSFVKLSSTSLVPMDVTDTSTAFLRHFVLFVFTKSCQLSRFRFLVRLYDSVD